MKQRSASALRLIEEHIDLLTAEDRARLGAAGDVLALRNALGGQHSASAADRTRKGGAR